jgi:hypothetical protein
MSEAEIKVFMEGMGADRTTMDEWRIPTPGDKKPYVFFDDRQATFMYRMAKQAEIEGMQQAKSRVLRRTEIPKDAKNPTRDFIVILGEEIARFIDQDIVELEALLSKYKGGN